MILGPSRGHPDLADHHAFCSGGRAKEVMNGM